MQQRFDFEGVMKRYGNFIEAHTRWYIPGYDRDDIRSEIIEILLKCLRNYDERRNVPFYPYFKRAVINQLCKLGARGRLRAHLYAEVNPLPDDQDAVPAAPEPDLADLAASNEFMSRVNSASLATRQCVKRAILGKPITATERREACAELLSAMGDEVHAWRRAQRVPLDSKGRPARRDTMIVGWRPAAEIRR